MASVGDAGPAPTGGEVPDPARRAEGGTEVERTRPATTGAGGVAQRSDLRVTSSGRHVESDERHCAPAPAHSGQQASASTAGKVAAPTRGKALDPAQRARVAGTVQLEAQSQSTAAVLSSTGASCQHNERRGVVAAERGDGHCMYRAVARQVLGSPSRYREMRRRCSRQLTSRWGRRRYKRFMLTGETWQARGRSVRANAWGGNLELQALADFHGALIQVWQVESAPGEPESFSVRNLITPARTAPKLVIRLLYNEAPGATNGDHYDTLWLRCTQCTGAVATVVPKGDGDADGAPGNDSSQGAGADPGMATLGHEGSTRDGGESHTESVGPAMPRRFEEALAMVGLEPHQWRRVGPSEFVTDNAGGLRAAAHAFLESDAKDIRHVEDLLAAADPSSAKRSLRRLVAAKPLRGLGSTAVEGSARQAQQSRASALDATSVAKACPWPYLGSLRRANADFNADHWQTQHVLRCASCASNPGDTRLEDGTVVRVSPDCAWYDMALRLFCGFDLPVGHLAEKWRQRLTAQDTPADAETLAWCHAAVDMPSRHPDNYASARQWSEAMDAKWSKELSAGWLRKATRQRVHTTVPMLGHVRFGERQRASAERRPVKVRFCSDLSHGEPSINGITPPWPFRYLTMRDVLTKLDRGWYCAVADVDSCFRRFAWNDEVHRYMGMQWRGDLCVDQRLCFGWSGAPAAVSAATSAVCEAVADAAQRELHLRPETFFVHAYLDDVISGAASRADCEALFELVQREFTAHGLPLKPSKSQPPATSFTYLGWYCDTQASTLTLTVKKRQELLSRVDACLARGVTRKTLESFAGALSHFVTAIPGGRCRMQSLWTELASRAGDPRAIKAVGVSTREDLRWLRQALQSSVATQLWHDYSKSVVIICDASGLDGYEAGFGAVCIGPNEVSVWQRQWSAAEREMFARSNAASSSTLREMLAAYLAAKHFRTKWADAARPVLFITDSSASACCILRGATRASAGSGVRPLLDQLCRDMSDMFVAAGSDFAAWWCSRDTACLRAVDWLSRTNTGQPRGHGDTVWTPGEFATWSGQASGADSGTVGGTARAQRRCAEATPTGSAESRRHHRSTAQTGPATVEVPDGPMVGVPTGAAPVPDVLRLGLRRDEVGQERPVGGQLVRGTDGSVPERQGVRLAVAGYPAQATDIRARVRERAAQADGGTPAGEDGARVCQPLDRGVPAAAQDGHHSRLGEDATEPVDQTIGGAGRHVRPPVSGASDGGSPVEASNLVRQGSGHAGVQRAPADGDNGTGGQSPWTAGVERDVRPMLRRCRHDTERPRGSVDSDSREGPAVGSSGPGTTVRDAIAIKRAGVAAAVHRGVVWARSAVAHATPPDTTCLSA